MVKRRKYMLVKIYGSKARRSEKSGWLFLDVVFFMEGKNKIAMGGSFFLYTWSAIEWDRGGDGKA